MSTNNIRIAVQKSGRLSEESLKLFKACGIKFESGGSKLKTVSSNFPIEFLFLRDDDIPGYVEDGVCEDERHNGGSEDPDVVADCCESEGEFLLVLRQLWAL